MTRSYSIVQNYNVQSVISPLTAHFDVSKISTSVVTLSNVTLCLYRKSATKKKVAIIIGVTKIGHRNPRTVRTDTGRRTLPGSFPEI